MNMHALLNWQWEGYTRYHNSRFNLLIHIFAVPLFLAGNVGLVVAAISRHYLFAFFSLGVAIIALVLQGRGHRIEKIPPEPFTGIANAIARIFLEQWITFPRFVLSGGWLRGIRRKPDSIKSNHH